MAYDEQFVRTLVVSTLIFCVVQLAIILVVWRFRASRPNTENRNKPGARNGRIELVWTTATVILFLGLLFMGRGAWADVQFTPAPREATVIEVQGKQFAWNFRYAGPDGQFGRTDVHLIDDAAGNPFGIDDGDPRGKDDIVTAQLRIPAGREIKLMLSSRDVIHSFFIRELRIKQDVVPGMVIPFHFRTDVPGTYEVPCSELCGLGHSQMRATVIVMPAGEFDHWRSEKERR